VAPGAFSTGSIFQWKRRRLRSGRAALALADEDAMDHRQEPAHPFAGPGSRADAIRADEAQHTTSQLPNDHGGTTTRSSATTSACSSNCLLEVVLTAGSLTRYWPGRNIASRQCSCRSSWPWRPANLGLAKNARNPPFPLSGLGLEPGQKNYERKANHRHPGTMRGWYFGWKETD
jgi:hypothetical protein